MFCDIIIRRILSFISCSVVIFLTNFEQIPKRSNLFFPLWSVMLCLLYCCLLSSTRFYIHSYSNSHFFLFSSPLNKTRKTQEWRVRSLLKKLPVWCYRPEWEGVVSNKRLTLPNQEGAVFGPALAVLLQELLRHLSTIATSTQLPVEPALRTVLLVVVTLLNYRKRVRKKLKSPSSLHD